FKRLRRNIRLLYIIHVLATHGLAAIAVRLHLFSPYIWLISLFSSEYKPKELGVQIRLALERLGPSFIKFGQMLSTRRDLLADDIADELERLQDNVPSFPGNLSKNIIEKAFGASVEDLFESFEEQPLASASVAQVHAAVLKTGENVVVKVLRPDILPVIKRDISLLFIIAELAAKYSSQLRRLRPVEVVAEYEKTILDELDLLREAANASQLRRNFEGSSDLYVPEIHWDFVRKNVLVMERIYGTPIREIDTLKEKGTDMERLAALGVEIFFTQVFSHNFFHADMHPGNILVDASDPENPSYIAVDFGIMGTLSPEDQNYLADNFLAFFNSDYRRVAELHVQSGWVPADTRVDEFEAAIRSVCEPIFAKPLNEISFGQVLLRLFQTARRFNMEVQPQLVLLQKTLLNIEGLGRQLYPELDLWKTAKPILEQWMHEKMGWQATLKTIQKEAPDWIQTLPKLPMMLHDIVQQTQNGKLTMQLSSRDLKELKQEVRTASFRSASAISGAAFIVGAAIIKGLDGYSPTMLAGMPILSWVFGLWGAILLYISLSK
ncbi:MAG: ubiquinone biosynthesis regulatory protein kinase UbiB, partial [Kangiellaceae bacterium]|nr:ubiquinone biosynthesis regulatory protein kinase UbiB [Kangiellaceae bacterium]